MIGMLTKIEVLKMLCFSLFLDPKKSNTAAILGGVIGGVVGVAMILAILLGILWKRKKDRAQLVGKFDLELAEGK